MFSGLLILICFSQKGGTTISQIDTFVSKYASSGISRFHMPGHKGNAVQLDKLGGKQDITEIQGADVLFSAEGIIAKTEQKLSKLYNCITVLSAGGSTLCIQTMLTIAAQRGGKILAGRNAHTALINTCGLLSIDPTWIYPDYNQQTGLPDPIKFQQIEVELLKDPSISTVYLTSPDYMGQMVDVQKIAQLCHKHHTLLLIDNAHGPHLRFTPTDHHPITLGADLCCDSAHKTLPALTGGAFLHAKSHTSSDLKSKMAIFGSTSPSYLILQSLDLCADYLESQAKQDFADQHELWKELVESSAQAGLTALTTSDCTKLSFDAYSIGKTGLALGKLFRSHKIEPEYISNRYVVLMLSPFNNNTDICRLRSALDELHSQRFENNQIKPTEPFCFDYPNRTLSPREAMFCDAEEISTQDAVGKICAENKILCPPGVPIVLAGEMITTCVQKLLKNSGIQIIKVVK